MADGRPADRRPLVLVDCRIARRRRTGGARYARGLAEHLPRAAAQAGIPVRVRILWGPPPLPRRNALTSAGNLLLDLAWTHLALPLLAVRHRAAAVHTTFNWAPVWTPCPRVVTIHDLTWERFPEAYPAGFRRFARLFTRLSARRAGHVVTISEASADDLTDIYRVPRQRIRVVYIGVDDPGEGRADRDPFVLHVGEFEPRKRVPALVDGYRAYRDRAGGREDGDPCELVLAGAGGADEAEVRRRAGEGVRMRGFVDDEELHDLYRRATLLVMPSRWEGFGLPVAEAMLAGCPVLVADTPALREAGGPAALVIPEPCDAPRIAGALERALLDGEDLRRRGERGRVHAERFGWDACVRDTLAVYAEAVAG